MHRNGITVLFLILFGSIWELKAQTNAMPALDSVTFFTPDEYFASSDYFDWIVQYHPLSKRAAIFQLEADAQALKARGGFDPKLYGDVEQKSFDGKDYFTIGETGVKLPSQLGLSFKGAYTWSRGIFLSPEDNLPQQGQAILGITANLGQGLVIDDRRADLQKARVLQQAGSTERRALLTDLLMRGNDLYWDWVFNYQVRQIYDRAVEVATQRLENTKQSFFNGDKPAIDTLESFILLQNRQNQLLETQLAFQNTTIALTNFLWTEDEIPFTATNSLNAPSLDDLPPIEPVGNRQIVLGNIPALRLYDFKLQTLDIERRLKTDKLKPVVNLDYNFLSSGSDFLVDQEAGFRNLFLQNYKWGLRASFPLFLRKARGDIELVKLKQIATVWQRSTKQQELSAKIQELRNDLQNITTQIDINEQAVRNYRQLLEAENIKFSIGESSLFLINSREEKLLDAQVKLSKLIVSYHKTLVKLRLVDGSIVNQY